MTDNISMPPGNSPLETLEVTTGKKHILKNFFSSGIVRFAGWWSIFAGVLALNSVCPVCGNTACPVGIGATGIIAGVGAAAKLLGGRIFRTLAGKIRQWRTGRVACNDTQCPDCQRGQPHQHATGTSR